MTDLPDIAELESGHDVRVEYRSKRSGNMVERTGTVSEVRESDGRKLLVLVHDEKRGFFSHRFVLLHEGETRDGNDCIGAVSLTTEPAAAAEYPPNVGRTRKVKHDISQTSTLGVVHKVIRVTPGAMVPNDVL